MLIDKRMDLKSGLKYKLLRDQESSEDDVKEETVEPNKLTVEEIVNKSIGADHSTASFWKFLGFFLVGMLGKMTGALLSHSPIFTGFLNYKDWECISKKCIDLMTNFTGEPVEFYTRDTICDNALKPHVDFNWTINRTSYALEWGLICSDESKWSNLKSFFFIGAFIGVAVGTALFDRIGRKTTTLIAMLISIVSCLATTFVNSYSIMLPMRVIHGIGAFSTLAGVELLSIEFTPSKYRNLCQIVSACLWTLGSLVMIGVSYWVKKWQHIFLIQGFIVAATAVVVFIYPESPRFQLVKGKEKEARTTFRRISKIFKTEEITEKADLTYSDYNQNYLDQVKDFKKYPVMLKNSALLMVSWMMISIISYGLVFSWGKLGSDIYTSILFSELGSFIAKGSGMIYFMVEYFGRRNALVINFAGIGLLFFIAAATSSVHITGTWTLDQVACLFSKLFISGTWSSMVLLTKEVSPTSHRGMVMCLCSASARIGAFGGSYLALLFNVLSPSIVLSMCGGMAALSSFLAFFNSDSTGKPIPSIPEDLLHLHLDNAHVKLVEEEEQKNDKI